LIDENDFSYLKRFFDVYVDQAKHNTHTFYSMLQESGWLCPGPRVFEETHEVYKYIYEKYFTEIFASRDDLVFVTLAEYAKWHKNEFKMENPPTVCVWDDIIYDSGKQYTWYQDQNARLLFDSDQGGSLVDIRPYVANIEKYRGSDSKDLWDASYPFLIQFFHRCNSIYKCEKESKLKELLRTEDSSEFIFEPVELKTSIGALSVQTSYKINRESFKLEVRRALKGKLSGEVSVKVREHFTGCWAADAHPSSLKGLELVLKAGDAERKLSYAYKSREIELDAASSAEVFFPVEGFRLSLIPEKDCKCFVKEGNINYNFYELGVESDIEKSVFDETIRTDLVVAPSSDK
jgi:hypothetical protein